MNTEYAVGNLRICFESRARRRWFVALCFVALAAADLACCLLNPKLNPGVNRLTIPSAWGAWMICSCAVVYIALLMVLTWLASDLPARSDERQIHRRQQAFSQAYPILGYCIVASFLAACFTGPNPITPLSPPALRELLVPLPFLLLMATFYLYLTLPPAILLWTEPDMEEAQ
jgi:hypothetical protein